MGLLTQNDSTLYRGWFKEMARLRGFQVKYRYVKEHKSSIHGELNPELSDKEYNIDIIYESNPKVKTLRAIGWVSETGEDKPYLMMFPYDTPNISVEARVYIPPSLEFQFKSKEFKITSISENMEYPDCYICTVVPVFQNAKVKDNYDGDNFNYIRNFEGN